MSIPELFRCPISLELFSDPVTLSTGQTYDRGNIERWFAGGHRTCPVTMQWLHDTSLIPNRTLRHLIRRWLLAAPEIDASSNLAKSTAITELSLPTLKENLKTPCTSATTKLETLRIVRALSLESEQAQAGLIQSGFLPLLLQLLFQAPRLNDAELVELVLDCILSLPSQELVSSLHVIENRTCLSSFVHHLSHGSAEVKTGICHLLETITPALSSGEMHQVMRALVSLLHDKANATPSEAALRAMSSLCSSGGNRADAVAEGAVDALITYIAGPMKSRRVCKALETLELLLGLEAGREAVCKNPSAVAALVRMVFRVRSDQGGSEHAIGSLLLLCRESARVRVEAINAGLLTQLLLLLQSQCSAKAKGSARALLKLLRAMWAHDGIGW